MTLDLFDDPLLDSKSAARYIGLKNHKTLSVWRCTKRVDLKPFKIGGAVRYRRSILDEYVASRQVL